MRITPLLFGDQPFVSWHSIDNILLFINYEHTTGHEDGELMVKSDRLTSCPRRVFNNCFKYAKISKIKPQNITYVRFLGDKEWIYGTDRD